MAKLSEIQTDAKLEAAGVWIPYMEDIELLIGSTSNPKFEAMQRRLAKPYRRQIRDETIPDPKADELVNKAAARYLLLGWRNLQDEKGKELEYSEAKAFQLLSDRRLRHLRRFVLDMAREEGHFRTHDKEDSAKN